MPEAMGTAFWICWPDCQAPMFSKIVGSAVGFPASVFFAEDWNHVVKIFLPSFNKVHSHRPLAALIVSSSVTKLICLSRRRSTRAGLFVGPGWNHLSTPLISDIEKPGFLPSNKPGKSISSLTLACHWGFRAWDGLTHNRIKVSCFWSLSVHMPWPWFTRVLERTIWVVDPLRWKPMLHCLYFLPFSRNAAVPCALLPFIALSPKLTKVHGVCSIILCMSLTTKAICLICCPEWSHSPYAYTVLLINSVHTIAMLYVIFQVKFLI